MYGYLFFAIANEPIFIVAEKSLRRLTPKIVDGTASYCSRLFALKRTEAWNTRMSHQRFRDLFLTRRQNFKKSLSRVRSCARKLFLDPAFLLEIAPCLDHELAQIVVGLYAPILKLHGRERLAWLDLTSYLTSVQTHCRADGDYSGLSSLGDLPDTSFRFTEIPDEVNREWKEQFVREPWTSFEFCFALVVALTTGLIEDFPATVERPFVLSNTETLFQDGRFWFACQKGAVEHMERRIQTSTELPEIARQYLLQVTKRPVKVPELRPGNPSTVKLKWMRRAARLGNWKFRKFKAHYDYDHLDETERNRLLQQIDRVLYKKSLQS